MTLGKWLFPALCRALALLAFAGPLALAGGPVHAAGFDLDALSQMARERAQASWQAPSPKLPAGLASLDYDGIRDIRFDPAKSLWRDAGLPFEVQFFHPSPYHPAPVRIHEIAADGVRPVPFDVSDFNYGKNSFAAGSGPRDWKDLGFAGLRIHYPLNGPQYKDELIVFQGASYFRALGAGQQYGLSARGLAIDTTGAAAEEFPMFTGFWLERPQPGANHLVVYALLESPRATGAYRFDIRPGPQSVVEVRARVFLRAGASVTTLGIAPLTSMFFFGENQPRAGDFRPEVHDSDGLMIEGGDGEWLWRPLQNPQRAIANSFALTSPRGFGLMQRDRSFASYEDVEANYQKRPSAWVKPLSDWGAGRIELLQLPTPDETHDNIAAYWVPAQLPAPGTPLEFAYELSWQGDAQQRPPSSWVTQTRRGMGYVKEPASRAGQVQYVVDFAGPALEALPAGATVQAVVSSNANGRIVEQLTYPNPSASSPRAWRMTLRVQRQDPAQPVELRAFLQHQNDTVSETWTHIILPE